MQAFLEYVVKGLVEHPEEVTITPVEREGTTIYELRLNAQDIGKIDRLIAAELDNLAETARFWKGYVTNSRSVGEVQLLLLWEQGEGYRDVRVLGFLLDRFQRNLTLIFAEPGVLAQTIGLVLSRIPNFVNPHRHRL